jgi:hypothetical protein
VRYFLPCINNCAVFDLFTLFCFCFFILLDINQHVCFQKGLKNTNYPQYQICIVLLVFFKLSHCQGSVPIIISQHCCFLFMKLNYKSCNSTYEYLYVPSPCGAVTQQCLAQIQEYDRIHGWAEHLAEHFHSGARRLRDIAETVVCLNKCNW